MGAISALTTAIETLKRNPVLFGAAFVVAIVNFGLTGVTTTVSSDSASPVSSLLSLTTFLFTPFFVGGLLTMADEGLDGRTRLGTFVAGGTDNYLRLLGAMVAFAVAIGVAAVAVMVGLAVIASTIAGAAVAGGGLVDSGSGFVLFVLVAVAGLVVMFLPTFFLQFYAAAVVVSDLDVMDSFRRSARLVRRNLVSTLGYTAVSVLIGLVTGVLAVAVTLLARPEVYSTTGATVPEVGTGTLLAVAVVAVALTTVVAAFGSVYQVAFYDDRLAHTPVGDDGAAVDPSVDVT